MFRDAKKVNVRVYRENHPLFSSNYWPSQLLWPSANSTARFGSAAIWGVQPIGRNALVGGPHGSALIEARTGRELRRYRRYTTSVLAGDAPFHY